MPDPTVSCGPYLPTYDFRRTRKTDKPKFGGPGAHDTIGMVALDQNGSMAAGTSTNGAGHKIPG